VPRSTDLASFCRRLAADPNVVYAEPNRFLRAAAGPSDPLFVYQWNLSGAPFGVDAAAVWPRATGTGIIVAVLDSGIAYEDRGPYRRLPDFAGTSFVAGYDFVNNDPYANDDLGHGTHVAGIIAQTTDNGLGCAGVAPGATLMPIKVLTDQGIGRDDWIASGIRYAADNGARVINLSLGGIGYSRTIQEALEYATSRGALLLAAAGNRGAQGIDYPAGAEQCLAVGATRFDGSRAYYSNVGPELDLVAPGGDTRVDQNRDGYPDGILQHGLVDRYPSRFRYRFEMGTSFAVAHVSGIAALVWSLHPEWSAGRVRRALLASARDLGPPGMDWEYGHGFVDLAKAVAASGDEGERASDHNGESTNDERRTTNDQRPTILRPAHDVAVEAGPVAPVRLGNEVSIPVTVANRGRSPESVLVTLTDETARTVLGSQTVSLQPEETKVLTFGWQASLPIGVHRLVADARLSLGAPGITDVRPDDNTRAFDMTVARRASELSLSLNKTSYRRGERLSMSLLLTARSPQLAAGSPLARVPIRVTVFGSTGAALASGTVMTNVQGRAVLVLPLLSSRFTAGLYRVQAEATAELHEVATATATFELRR
jgi:serine protease